MWQEVELRKVTDRKQIYVDFHPERVRAGLIQQPRQTWMPRGSQGVPWAPGCSQDASLEGASRDNILENLTWIGHYCEIRPKKRLRFLCVCRVTVQRCSAWLCARVCTARCPLPAGTGAALQTNVAQPSRTSTLRSWPVFPLSLSSDDKLLAVGQKHLQSRWLSALGPNSLTSQPCGLRHPHLWNVCNVRRSRWSDTCECSARTPTRSKASVNCSYFL